MSELQKSLEGLLRRLDRMGLRVEEAVQDALGSAREGNVISGEQIDENDAAFDAEEVEIERDCIRLLALYQPAAVDLRAICFLIKANNDLERIADKAAHIGRRVKHLVAERIDLHDVDVFQALATPTLKSLGMTVRMLSTHDQDTAREIIANDNRINQAYKDYVRFVLSDERFNQDADRALTLILLARALERIGDLCTNIAEDVIFLRTGDIVRHASAQEQGSS